MGFRGAIFDVDGVLVDSPHERAWRDALRQLMDTDWHDIFALAAASSSKNAGEFLKCIPLDVFAAERGLPYDFTHEGMTLLNLFDADISGRDFEHGKPHDLSDGTAGAWLPARALFVVEDASPGCRRARWPRWERRG